MKIGIISDLHANLEALNAFPGTYDELWVLGDLVTYGPDPAAVVDAVRERTAVIVRGNHDNAVGAGEDPQCSAAFRDMAQATLAFTGTVLSREQKAWLGSLPLRAEREVGGARFFLCHAVPSDPLFTYCSETSPRWDEEVAASPADIVLVGHTHLPFVRKAAGRLVVNPGSLGQPKNGQTHACYAVWEDGRISLRSYEYPVEQTIRKVLAMPIPEEIRRRLAHVLNSGGDPRGHHAGR
jgi:putative phosphoesterase